MQMQMISRRVLFFVGAPLLLVACKPNNHDLAKATAIAAATPDLSTPWPLHVISAGAPTGPMRGADGVDLRGTDIATAWEEGGSVTVAHRPADVTLVWPTDVVAAGLVGVEDAKLGDIDGDGVVDVVSGSDSGQRVYVSFGGGGTIDIAASHGHNRVMQVALADVDGDGHADIVFGTRVGTSANPAVVAWLANPGVSARDPAAWMYHPISLAGWAMSLVPLDVDGDGDLDVVVSDRASYKDALSVTRWDLYGARWEEQTPSGWATHAISTPAGSCTTCTPGDEMFLRVVDWDGDGQLDVVDGTSSATHLNRIAIRRNLGGWLSWSQELVPAVDNVGHYQGVDVGDLDGDGRPDLVVSTWKGNALPVAAADAGKSGVYWLHNTATGWERGEVSGPAGCKFDNPVLFDVDGDGDLDIVNSEQLGNDCTSGPPGGTGVLWYEHPGIP